MRKFTMSRITLFDSTVACFKLSVEATFTSQKQDGSTSSMAYVTTPKLNPNTNKWSEPVAVLDPNIYLVFTYKGDTFQNTKTVYTSYPQLFRIREAMETIKNYIVTGEGFSTVDGALYADPTKVVSVTDIGKSKKSITFKLQSVAVDNTMEKIPGVAIHISDSEYLSLLSADEFLTIYTIVKDIDLASIQTQLSIAYLNGLDSAAPAVNNYNPNPYQGQYNNSGYSAPQYNGNFNYSQPPVQNAPAYSRTNGMRRQAAAPNPNYMAPAPTQTQPVVENTVSYAPPANPFPETKSQTLPPRNNKPLINLETVEEVPVSTISFNDDDAVNAIFGLDN